LSELQISQRTRTDYIELQISQTTEFIEQYRINWKEHVYGTSSGRTKNHNISIRKRKKFGKTVEAMKGFRFIIYLDERSSVPGKCNDEIFFLFATASRPALRPTQLPIQWVPKVKLPAREANNSPPSRAEVKNEWNYTSTPQYVFMAWCLIKYRDNFTLPNIRNRSE